MLSNKEEYRMADLLFGQQVEDELNQLNLSMKTHACLTRAGIATLAEVFELDKKQLSLIPNMNKRMVKEVEDKIAAYLNKTVRQAFHSSQNEDEE